MSDTKPSRKRPSIPLPEPLRAAELGTYTHHSVVVRLPEIGHQIVADNDFTPPTNAALERLINDIPDGSIRPLTDTDAPDTAAWAAYISPYEGRNWLETPWFFVETYFYRRVLEATGYFVSGHPHYGRDPFAHKKQEGLDFGRKQIRDLIEWIDALFTVERVGPDIGLERLLSVALWGNQADLSLWPAGKGIRPQHDNQDQEKAHLLADDSALVVAYLNEVKGGRVDMVLDNAGFELISDLCLTDFLLFSGLASSVRWHLKTHPTFVSDAMTGDVIATVDWLLETSFPILYDMGRRLQSYLEKGWWQLVDDPFWTSPLPMWEMTADLHHQLAESDFIIIKGDANYRRLLGDRHWSFTTPFNKIVSYAPALLLVLRTLKSEVAAGITAEKIAMAKKEDADWMVNGRWGVIQLVIG